MLVSQRSSHLDVFNQMLPVMRNSMAGSVDALCMDAIARNLMTFPKRAEILESGHKFKQASQFLEHFALNSGNGGNGGNGRNDGKMIIIIIDYVGDGGNDIQRLDSTVERYFLRGLAESTRKTYNSAKRRYSEFAAKHGFQPLSASEHQLCQFVSYQAEGKLCHSTIKCYLSAVRQM